MVGSKKEIETTPNKHFRVLAEKVMKHRKFILVESNMSSKIIKFNPFDNREFREFRERSTKEMAQASIRAGQRPESNAVEEALKGFDTMLPQGMDTPNHHLNNITNEQGENIGYIWFVLRSNDIFICEFLIYENQRGKGFAKQTLFELERIAKTKSIPKICLHIFEYNTQLQEFYKAMGYEIALTKPGSCWMQKVI